MGQPVAYWVNKGKLKYAQACQPGSYNEANVSKIINVCYCAY